MGSGFEMAKLVSSTAQRWLRLVLSVTATGILSLPGQPVASEPETPTLFDTSQAFVWAYNTQAYEKLEAILSPSLRETYGRRKIAAEILKCRKTLFETIIRTSLPTSGGKYWGFFAVYGRNKNTSMLMEIDGNGKIIAFMMGDNLIDGEYECGFLN